MKAAIAKDLQRILDKQAINWPIFKKRLMKCGYSVAEIDSTFRATLYSHNCYRVEVISPENLMELHSVFFKEPPKNRAEASNSIGDSHAVNVEGALLAAGRVNAEIPYNYQFLPGMPLPSPRGKYALIIENLECFLNREATFQFVQDHCGVDIKKENVECLMGAGNSITNCRITPFLKQYKSILCLFDLDYGGLKIFTTLLSQGFVSDEIQLLIPDDVKSRLARSERVATAEEMQNLDKVWAKAPEVDRLVTLIRFFERTLEQESYRA